MRREPAISFRGALQILGHHDRLWLTRLDRLLGGAILASGAIPAISALWGWVDQKNEATRLLRHALDFVADRVTTASGLARHELVVAAHTTAVLAAFFETLRDHMEHSYDEAEISEAEKVYLGTGDWQHEHGTLVRHLYAAEVPSPSAVRGFEENVPFITDWAEARHLEVAEFFVGIGIQARGILSSKFAKRVSRRYRSDYLTLATKVPEFKIWADLGEHAATRTALARLSDMLVQQTPVLPHRDLRALLAGVNQAELDRPVIDVHTDGYGIDAVFPTVRDIFVTPHFKCALATKRTRVGDENWWKRNFQPQQDLDVVLARHFSTPDATRRPLLLLGHPGSGKSLLTKVLAAQLPATTFTTVRVPLRQVDADAHVSTQIQQALSHATNGRVSWPELDDQNEDTIRVVLLDGLDELLQATTNDRAGYLTDIVEFQRIEAALGKPVSVVVTSRTLVVDRVLVPEDTPVVKLEDFDDDQIRSWLHVWNEVNANTGTRLVTEDIAMQQGELARQPLLLLMLTLYFADPSTELPDENLSTTELYRRIFDTYARREATKRAIRRLPDEELEEAVHMQLIRLSTAALGMFNRGHQSIIESELSADLAALGDAVPAGDRLLGEFFFVHAPEANAGASRSYEFLHATFGEYLVAARLVDVLADVAEGAFGRRRIHDPDDELLAALLSYQPLAIQRPALDFLAELIAAMNAGEREDVQRTLALLIRTHRTRRTPTRHPDYRPLPIDTIRSMAAYLANLMLLYALAMPAGVDLPTLWPNGDETHEWPALVDLWSAGLNTDGYRSMIETLAYTDGKVTVTPRVLPQLTGYIELAAARLRGAHDTERLLMFGHAVRGTVPADWTWDERTWKNAVVSLLLHLTHHGPLEHWAPPHIPEAISRSSIIEIADMAYRAVGLHCPHWTSEFTEEILRWLMRLQGPASLGPMPLMLAEINHPGLLDTLRSAPDDLWTAEWRNVLQLTAAPNKQEENVNYYSVFGYLKQVTEISWTTGKNGR